MTKLLIDKCLSPELALMARARGHFEASHVVWIGRAGWKDWELKPVLLEQDWNSSVTLNLFAQAVTDAKRSAQSKVARLVFQGRDIESNEG